MQQDSLEFAKKLLEHYEPILGRAAALPPPLRAGIAALFCGSLDMVTKCAGCGRASVRSPEHESRPAGLLLGV